MSIPLLFSQALGLHAPWTIEKIDFDPNEKRLDIHIGFERGSTFFYKDPDTGQEGTYKAYDTQEKT